jgi:hypothetical protein
LEIGYISSGDDVAKLISSEWRDRAAVHVARSIEKYFADKAAFDKSASDKGEPTGALARGADAPSADKKPPVTEKMAAGGAPARP